MTIVYFITHPEVTIDPAIPVPNWPLSPVGVHRVCLAAERPWLRGVRSLFSSGEYKARQTAQFLADRLGLAVSVIEQLGENDRSATGYLPRAEFEAVADEFFARPQEHVRGWERAADAQRRVIDAVDLAIMSAKSIGDIAIVSHGGVGALLLCHLKGVPISRMDDQPGDKGGNVYSFDRHTRRLVSDWWPIEA